MAVGYRFGDLRDLDFATNGGSGAFLTPGIRVTEATLPTVSAFWRSRIGRRSASGAKPMFTGT